MTTADVRAVLAEYGAGLLDDDAAAEALRPDYLAAVTERAERDPGDPDAGSTPTPWVEVDVARWTGTVSVTQCAALADRLAARRR